MEWELVLRHPWRKIGRFERCFDVSWDKIVQVNGSSEIAGRKNELY